MATKRLYRDTDHAMIGGVCAGLANRVGLDPTLVRVATLALTLVMAGTTILLYIALWIIIPAQPASDDQPTRRPSRSELTEEVRDAAARATEAAQILARAAQQAADELSRVQGRRTTSTSQSPPGSDTAQPGTPPPAPPPSGRPPASEQIDEQQRPPGDQGPQGPQGPSGTGQQQL